MKSISLNIYKYKFANKIPKDSSYITGNCSIGNGFTPEPNSIVNPGL